MLCATFFLNHAPPGYFIGKLLTFLVACGQPSRLSVGFAISNKDFYLPGEQLTHECFGGNVKPECCNLHCCFVCLFSEKYLGLAQL